MVMMNDDDDGDDKKTEGSFEVKGYIEKQVGCSSLKVFWSAVEDAILALLPSLLRNTCMNGLY